jgi:type II secretory pathway component PulF
MANKRTKSAAVKLLRHMTRGTIPNSQTLEILARTDSHAVFTAAMEKNIDESSAGIALARLVSRSTDKDEQIDPYYISRLFNAANQSAQLGACTNLAQAGQKETLAKIETNAGGLTPEEVRSAFAGSARGTSLDMLNRYIHRVPQKELDRAFDEILVANE